MPVGRKMCCSPTAPRSWPTFWCDRATFPAPSAYFSGGLTKTGELQLFPDLRLLITCYGHTAALASTHMSTPRSTSALGPYIESMAVSIGGS
jgi:hypothetical protein